MNQIVREIEGFLEKVKDIYSIDKDQQHDKSLEKYGETIIRVHWMYVNEAAKHPYLKQVCVWSNGDQGYVFQPPAGSH